MDVIDIRRRVLGPEHPDTLKSMNNLNEVRKALGAPAVEYDAEPFGERRSETRPQ